MAVLDIPSQLAYPYYFHLKILTEEGRAEREKEKRGRKEKKKKRGGEKNQKKTKKLKNSPQNFTTRLPYDPKSRISPL